MAVNASVPIQKSIKDNADELQNFMTDLTNWEKDMKRADEQLAQSAQRKKLVPKKEIMKKSTNATASSDGIKTKSMSATEIVNDEQRKLRANSFKEQGNKCYTSGNLDDAVSKYTQGMALDPNNAILPSNRAMALIKLEKFEAAEKDCSRCLQIDPSYIKGYLRRGLTRFKLGKLQLALDDYTKVLELEPGNKDSKKELLEIKKLLSQKSDITATADQRAAGDSVSVSAASLTEYSVELNEADVHTISSPRESNSPVIPRDENKFKDPDVILPVQKLPFDASKKPLRRIQVVNIESEDKWLHQIEASSLARGGKLKGNIKTSEETVKKRLSTNLDEIHLPQQELDKTTLQFVPCLPKTSHQFTQNWLRLNDQQSKLQYLLRIEPKFFQRLELDGDILFSVVDILRLNEFTPACAAQLMTYLMKTEGFTINVLFWNEGQRRVAHQVLEKCEDVAEFSAEVKKLKIEIPL